MRKLFLAVALLCSSPLLAQTCSNTTVGAFTCVSKALGSTSVVYASGFTAGQTVIVSAARNNTHTWISGDFSSTDGNAWVAFTPSASPSGHCAGCDISEERKPVMIAKVSE